MIRKFSWLNRLNPTLERDNPLVNEGLIWIGQTFIGIFGAILNFFPSVISGFKFLQPIPIDALFNSYVMEHTFRAFFERTYAFTWYSPGFYYPEKMLLTYSDNLIGTAPIYWIFRTFSSWNVAFGLWEITVLVLSYLTLVYMFQTFGISKKASTLLSFVFTFLFVGLYRIAAPQLLPFLFIPLSLTYLYKFLNKPDSKSFNLFLGFLVLQTLTGYYLGWFYIFSLAIFFPVSLVFLKEHYFNIGVNVKQHTKVYILSIIVWLGILALFWAPYVYTSFQFKYAWNWDLYLDGLPKVESGVTFISVLFFLVSSYLLIKKPFSKWSYPEIFLAVYCIFYILMIYVGRFSLWYFIWQFFPGADGIRYIYRFWVVAYIYFFTGAGLAVNDHKQRFIKSIDIKPIFYTGIFLIGLAGFNFSYIYYDALGFSSNVSFLKQRIIKDGCKVFYLNIGETDIMAHQRYNVLAMWAALDSNIPTANGYTGITSETNLKELKNNNFQVCTYAFKKPITGVDSFLLQ